MKPKAFDGMDGSYILGIGTTHQVSGPDSDEPAGRLYVPDPEARHHWREHFVQKAPKPGARPIGFTR